MTDSKKNDIDEFSINKEGHMVFNILNNFDKIKNEKHKIGFLTEEIIYYYFHLIRQNTEHTESALVKILNFINTDIHEYSNELSMIVKIIANTRDIVYGKGERDLSYMQIYVLYNYYPTIAKKLLVHFFYFPYGRKPYGSWCDVKYLCQYIKNKTSNQNHPLINFCVKIMNDQISYDLSTLTNHNASENNYVSIKNINKIYNINYKYQISFAVKWVPRKSSKKFKWLNKKLANNYFSDWFYKSDGMDKDIKKNVKSIIYYNKIIVSLTRFLSIPETKMCRSEWELLDFNTISAGAINKYKKAFQNNKNQDRVMCRARLMDHLRTGLHDSTVKINAKNLELYHIVKSAVNSVTVTDRMLIDAQWKNHLKENHHTKLFLNKVIPLVDMGFNMEKDNCRPLYNAIGLGLTCSQKNHDFFKNKLITFSSTARFIELDSCITFYNKICNVLNTDNKGLESNVYSAFDLLLHSFVEKNITNFEIKSLTIMIFSTMEFCAIKDYSRSLMVNLSKMFAKAGRQTKYRKPYDLPNIVLWNVGKHEKEVCFGFSQNVTFVSGYNSNVLNRFCLRNNKREHQRYYDPYSFLLNMLNGNRYNFLEVIVKEYVEKI